MAAEVKCTSSSTVGTSESMSTVFSSCRVLDVADFEEGLSGNGAPSIFRYHPSTSTERVGSDMRYYIVQSSKGYRNRHICDTCYLCKKHIHNNQEIYMYRGELPFCSTECRKEQIEMDLSLQRLHQTQLKNQKHSLVPVDQNNCSMESDSYIECGFGYFRYNVIRYFISLVVG